MESYASKRPEDLPPKLDNIKKLDIHTKKDSFLNRTTSKKTTVCKALLSDFALLIDFASIKIEIEKCEMNAEFARVFTLENKTNFNLALKNFLKTKVKEFLKIGNVVTSKYYVPEFKSLFTIVLYVRNSTKFNVDIINEILKLCDTTLVDEVMLAFNNI